MSNITTLNQIAESLVPGVRAAKIERAALLIVSYLATARKQNTDEWMRGAEELINEYLNFIGDDANVAYDGDRLVTVAAPEKTTTPAN